MIPIRTTALPQRTPWVNYSLIGANLVVFAYELTLGVRIEAFVWDYGWVSANFSQALHQQTLPPLLPLHPQRRPRDMPFMTFAKKFTP